MAQVTFKKGQSAKLSTSRDSNTLYFVEDLGVLYLGDKRFSDVVLATTTPTLTTVKDNQIHIYNNKLYFKGTEPLSTGTGSSDAVICVDVGEIATKIAALTTLIGEIPEDAESDNVIEYIDEVVDEAKSDLTTAINNKVASVSAADGSINVDNTTATAPKLKVNVHTVSGDEAANMVQVKDDGIYVATPAAADTYEIKKADDSGAYAAVYQLIKKTNGTGAGTAVGDPINIAKDLFVKEGSVVTITADTKGKDGNPAEEGTYIKLVLQNQTDPLFIPVDSLIEYVTSGSDTTNDAVVIAVSTDHKVTATLTDGKITLAKLESDVQTKINQAHTHANKELLDTYDQTNDALKDAVSKKHEHANAEELAKIATGDKSKWDTAAIKAGTAVQSVKVNGTAVTADESQAVDITAVTGTTNGTIKIADQPVAVYGLNSAAYQTTEYFVGTAADTADNDTIKGAKKYADSKVAAALSWEEF